MLSFSLSLYIFNVRAGQCIFVCPYNDLNYCTLDRTLDCTLIDCGCDNRVLNFVKSRLPKNILGNLTLTNYDEDHFSGITAISQQNIEIKTICFAHNLECEEIRQLKTEETPNLKKILDLKKKTYDHNDHNMLNWLRPYKEYLYCLDKSDLEECTTNNLSQMVFLEYGNFMMCVPGDLEQEGWEKILKKEGVIEKLKSTNVLIASHHGRENGYYPEVFNYCKPECIIISDGGIEYDTQKNMPSKYAQHVKDGINFCKTTRQVLTTRKDGDLLINIDHFGNHIYLPGKIV